MNTLTDVIQINDAVMSGTPVFRGTRVPIQHLLDHLVGNETVTEFLLGYPSVSRAQAVALVRLMAARVLAEKMPQTA